MLLPSRPGLPPLRQQLFRDLTCDVGQTEVPALEFVGEALMIDAQAVENRGLQVVNVDWIGDDVVAVIVRLAEHRAGLYAAAGHPHAEAARMVIAAVVGLHQLALAIDRTPKFSAPD